MLQALWSVELLTADRAVPAGVLIFHLRRVFGDYFQMGRLFGGDSQYYYAGEYQIENMVLSAWFDVVLYGNEPQEIFGPARRCRVDFGGRLDACVERDAITFAAQRSDDKDVAFEIRLTKREPLE